MSRPGHTSGLSAWMLAMTLAILGCVVPVRAGETEDLYNQLMHRYEQVNDQIRKLLNDLDYETPIPGYPERMLSVRRNAEVTIGGEVRTTYAVSRSKWDDPGFNPNPGAGGKGESRLGDLSLNTAKLLVEARVGKRWLAFIDLDLNMHHGMRPSAKLRNPNDPGTATPTNRYTRVTDDEIIGQAYVELLKDGHSGFGFKVGQMKLPFGLWARPILFAQSFLDSPNLTGSYLAAPEGYDDRGLLPHASRFLDPVVAAMINYEMRDIVRFEAAVFQEKEDGSVADGSAGERRYRRSYAPPRSWQVGFSLLPLEGWELTAHFRNRSSRAKGMDAWINSPSRWDFARNLARVGHNPRWDAAQGQWSADGTGESFGARGSEQALVVGVAAEIPNTKLAVSAEYAHGWNQGFNKFINSDSVNLSLSYRATPFLTLHAQGEWLHVKDRSWMAPQGGGWARDTRNNHLYRVMFGAEYEVTCGVTVEAGWQYEYWKQRSYVQDRERIGTAGMFYLGTRFVF